MIIEGKVFNIMKYSIHDGPGIRNTVFLKGCPLNCWWCHNPESQRLEDQLMFFPNRCMACMACIQACERAAIVEIEDRVITDKGKCIDCGACTLVCFTGAREMVGKTMTVDEVMAEVLKDRDFFQESGGGVTISGGEPLMQWKFLIELLMELRNKGIHTTVDTSGYAPKKHLEEVSKYTDLFLYDLKHMDGKKHKIYTGVDNAIILDNLRFLDEMGKEIIVRIPLIPGINDSKEDLKEFNDYIRALSGVRQVDLLPYHKIGEEKYRRLAIPYRMQGIEEPSEKYIEIIAHIIQSTGKKVKIGG